MSPTAFFKLCCVPVSVLKAFFADYMMASVLERRFVNKKRNCCFTPQVLGYAVVLCARLPFVTHENTVYVSIIKLAAYLVAVIFMYIGKGYAAIADVCHPYIHNVYRRVSEHKHFGRVRITV